jgi:hypothetical protein
MLAHGPIGCLLLWTLSKLVLPPDEHHLISYSTSCTPRRHGAHALCLRPCHPAPPTSSPPLTFSSYGYLKNWRRTDVGGAKWQQCRHGVLELNATNEWWEVEQETRCHRLLLIGRWVGLEIVGRWGQQVACVQACVFRPVWWDTVSKQP